MKVRYSTTDHFSDSVFIMSPVPRQASSCVSGHSNGGRSERKSTSSKNCRGSVRKCRRNKPMRARKMRTDSTQQRKTSHELNRRNTYTTCIHVYYPLFSHPPSRVLYPSH